MEFIFLWIVGLLILYAVIFYSVKHGIDSSKVGKLIKTKYGVEDEVAPVCDDEIEQEFDDEFDKN